MYTTSPVTHTRPARRHRARTCDATRRRNQRRRRLAGEGEAAGRAAGRVGGQAHLLREGLHAVLHGLHALAVRVLVRLRHHQSDRFRALLHRRLGDLGALDLLVARDLDANELILGVPLELRLGELALDLDRLHLHNLLRLGHRLHQVLEIEGLLAVALVVARHPGEGVRHLHCAAPLLLLPRRGASQPHAGPAPRGERLGAGGEGGASVHDGGRRRCGCCCCCWRGHVGRRCARAQERAEPGPRELTSTSVP
mmetsp:Transcript_7534/g.27667  ORF Transcript_7534/g.27667 Transcript_7534/m.27667 type:complete len:253 (-) Transcript_7534:184-942(-)